MSENTDTLQASKEASEFRTSDQQDAFEPFNPVVAEVNAKKPSRIKDLLGILGRIKGKSDEKAGTDQVENQSDNLQSAVEPPKVQEEPRVTEDQPQHTESDESEKIAKVREYVAGAIAEIQNWEALLNEELPDDSTLEDLTIESSFMQRRDLELKLAVYNIDPASQLTPEQRLQKVQEIRANFQRLRKLEARTIQLELDSVGAKGVGELEAILEIRKPQFDDDYFEFSGKERDIVWQVVEPYVSADARFGDKDYVVDNLMSIWRAPGILSADDTTKILQEIAGSAKAAGETSLYDRTRAKLANQALSTIKEIEGETHKSDLDKKLKEFKEAGREMILVDVVNLARSVDRNNPDARLVQHIADTLVTDHAQLEFIADSTSSRVNPQFLERLVTNDLAIPLSDQPAYLRQIVARRIMEHRFNDFAQSLPIEKISTTRLYSAIAERLGTDLVIADLAKNKLRGFTILGKNSHLASLVRESGGEYSQLIDWISAHDDWEGLGRRFEAITAKNDEASLAWEYFRLTARERRNYEGINLPYEIPAHVPGMPENLQWGNLSREQRKRLLSRYAHDRTLDGDVFVVNDLNEIGKALITRNVLKEVVRRSADLEEKNKADERNREVVSGGKGELHAGDLMHGTDVKNLHALLTGGDRAGEFLGFDQKGDVTPLGADFSQVLEVDADGSFNYTDAESLKRLNPENLRWVFRENPFKAIYFASIASQYGARPLEHFTSQDAKSEVNSGVTLIFDRQRPDAFLKGMEYQGHMREHHKLVFVGLPATEVSGIIVNGQSEGTIEKVKAEVTNNGFYVPSYDLEGDLIFTPDEYDQIRQARGTPTA